MRASPLGRWLGTGPAAEPGRQIILAEVVRQRGAVLFSLDRAAHGRAADTIANLVAQDAAGFCAGLRRAAIAGDGLAWFGQCETVDPQALAGLVATGADSGFVTVLSTTSAAAASRLADQASVLVLHRLDDHRLAGQLAWLTGRRLVPAGLHPAYPGPGAVAAGAGRVARGCRPGSGAGPRARRAWAARPRRWARPGHRW